MSKSYLVCFVGIDGAGKTTIARRLTEEMGKNGIKTKYLMGRFEDFKLLKPLLWGAKLAFLSGKKTDESPEGVKTKRGLLKNPLVAGIWRLSVRADYVFQLGYKVRLPLILGRSTCADRYVYDAIVDLTADSAISISKMQNSLHSLLRLVPRPDVVFMIDLPEGIAYERNLVKHDNLSRDYLGERRRLFLAFKDRPEVEVMDGTLNADELFKEILKKMKTRKILV